MNTRTNRPRAVETRARDRLWMRVLRLNDAYIRTDETTAPGGAGRPNKSPGAD